MKHFLSFFKIMCIAIVSIGCSLSIAATTAMADTSITRGNEATRPDEILDRVV